MVALSTIRQVREKNQRAFKVLYQESIAYVYAIVKRYVTNESDYADVIQEIYARVFLSIKNFDSTKGDFKFWLRRIVINQCLQHYRQRKSPTLFVPIDSVDQQENQLFTKQLDQLSKDEIETYLQQMPMGYKQVFMLVIIDEYAHQEVAELLGISVETSRSQLSRAKNWLRKNIISKKKNKFIVRGF